MPPRPITPSGRTRSVLGELLGLVVEQVSPWISREEFELHYIDSGNLDRDRWVGVAWFGLSPGPVDCKREEGSRGCCEAVSCHMTIPAIRCCAR